MAEREIIPDLEEYLKNQTSGTGEHNASTEAYVLREKQKASLALDHWESIEPTPDFYTNDPDRRVWRFLSGLREEYGHYYRRPEMVMRDVKAMQDADMSPSMKFGLMSELMSLSWVRGHGGEEETERRIFDIATGYGYLAIAERISQTRRNVPKQQ